MKHRHLTDMLEDFWAALGTQVRTEEGGGLTDTREQFLLPLLREPVGRIIELMGDTPADLAAMCSGVVGIGSRLGVLMLAGVKRRDLCDAVQHLRIENEFPLAGVPHHPATAFLGALLESDDGRLLYQRITRVLCAARDDRTPENGALRACLYVPSSYRNVIEEEGEVRDV